MGTMKQKAEKLRKKAIKPSACRPQDTAVNLAYYADGAYMGFIRGYLSAMRTMKAAKRKAGA